MIFEFLSDMLDHSDSESRDPSLTINKQFPLKIYINCWKLCHLSLGQILRNRTFSSWSLFAFLSVIYVCWTVLQYHYPLRWGRGVSKRYLMDITCGMGSKTCQNMISILKYSPYSIAHNVQIGGNYNKPLTFRSHEAKTLEKSLFQAWYIYWSLKLP